MLDKSEHFNEFKRKAKAVSSEVFELRDLNAAALFMKEFLPGCGVADTPGRRALWARPPKALGARKDEMVAAVPGLSFDVTKRSAAESLVGISSMELGIADTGTLVQDATPVDLRLVSTLPDIHIAMLSRDKIVPNLAAILDKVKPSSAGYLSFITGPSRTADIERVLAIGAHGPKRLIILAIESGEVLT